ncbi:hypothetical protein Tco_0989641 [Tanacetum coccineum]|uniref:Uncharacterized protein n=1 Tax=Tanacetum coccineum TaxID=301880 RepID=A0ABQ5EUL4_9ASTR
MDSNPSQPSVSTPVDTGMHKEDQQATSGPTSLGVTSEARANPQLSTVSTTEVDPVKSAPSDFVPQQQGINEGTKNTSYDHLFVGTDPHVLADQTKSVSEGLEIVLTQPRIGKGASSIARQVEEEEASNIINDEDDEDKSQKHKLELEKNKAEAEVSLLKAQPSFPNVGQLNELLVKSLQTEFSKILYAHDFSRSLPTELKDLPSKFNELTKVVKGLKQQVHELEIELPGDLKEIPSKLEDFTKTVTSLTSQVVELKTLQWELLAEFVSLPVQVASVQAKLKTLDALPSLLLNVIKALNKFAQVLDSASSKAGDQSVPSAGQADTMPTEGEKNTNQATIS